jgi:hypothetical protein
VPTARIIGEDLTQRRKDAEAQKGRRRIYHGVEEEGTEDTEGRRKRFFYDRFS